MLRPAYPAGEEPADVDLDRVAAVAAAYGVPAAPLVSVLRAWLWHWTNWREAVGIRQEARDRQNKKAGRAERRGDPAGAEEARAVRRRGTELVRWLEQHLAWQTIPEQVEQVGERLEAARAAAARETDPAEPELWVTLEQFWHDHKGEWPATGSGDVANTFGRFVAECAAAIGIHAAPEEGDAAATRWRNRARRLAARLSRLLSPRP